MKRIETALPGVFLIEPRVFSDERGFFFESYQKEKYLSLGIADEFVQDNQVRSIKGVIRGLHYQHPRPQAKLCRVAEGEVLDVVVDIRAGSPHFGKHVSAILSAENKLQIYVPAGFAHGYSVLSERAEFLYKCSDYYHPQFERGVAWDDADLGIDWLVSSPLLSERDLRNPQLSKIPTDELPPYR
ncbi:MAG TPA: dTDP-4-dehydrorhamnose 3,5-epimerase [Blastocatellia bacterium]|jgi:dTDP-4-dehydrorhamnose 3,5-epimerase